MDNVISFPVHEFKPIYYNDKLKTVLFKDTTSHMRYTLPYDASILTEDQFATMMEESTFGFEIPGSCNCMQCYLDSNDNCYYPQRNFPLLTYFPYNA